MKPARLRARRSYQREILNWSTSFLNIYAVPASYCFGLYAPTLADARKLLRQIHGVDPQSVKLDPNGDWDFTIHGAATVQLTTRRLKMTHRGMCTVLNEVVSN